MQTLGTSRQTEYTFNSSLFTFLLPIAEVYVYPAQQTSLVPEGRRHLHRTAFSGIHIFRQRRQTNRFTSQTNGVHW